MRARALLQNVLLILGSIVFLLVALELSARALDILAPREARSWSEHRLRIPPPYQGAPYDVPELIAEDQKLTWQTDPTYGWLPEDFAGRYINIANHQRRTTGQPEAVTRRVWFFGGSTAMGVEVPDEFTIASQLQALLNTAGIAGTAVENMGATTISSSHELYRLTHMTEVAAGDVVLFYDGVNDTIQDLYYQNPDGTMVEGNRDIIAQLPWLNQQLFWLYQSTHSVSAFVNRFLDPTSPAYRQIVLSDARLATFAKSYADNIRAAHDFAKAHGAGFLEFLQPNIYTVSSHTPYEDEILANGWLYPSNLRDVYAAGYPVLLKAIAGLRESGIETNDLTHAFDARTRDIFLDYTHVNEHGNALIAAAIAERLIPLLKP